MPLVQLDQRATTGLRALAVVLAVVGSALALGATVGVPAAGVPALFAGLGLLTVAVGALAVAAHSRSSRQSADAVVVMGYVTLHLLALVVALLAAAHALLAANGLPWRRPATWGLASATWLAASYGWDRWTATDVDAVLDDSSWYRQ